MQHFNAVCFTDSFDHAIDELCKPTKVHQELFLYIFCYAQTLYSIINCQLTMLFCYKILSSYAACSVIHNMSFVLVQPRTTMTCVPGGNYHWTQSHGVPFCYFSVWLYDMLADRVEFSRVIYKTRLAHILSFLFCSLWKLNLLLVCSPFPVCHILVQYQITEALIWAIALSLSQLKIFEVAQHSEALSAIHRPRSNI